MQKYKIQQVLKIKIQLTKLDYQNKREMINVSYHFVLSLSADENYMCTDHCFEKISDYGMDPTEFQCANMKFFFHNF